MKKMVLACAASLVLLSGCLFPEKFKSTITFSEDGSYTTQFDGTAVNVMGAMVIADRGKLAPADDQALKAEADKYAKAPGVSKAKYIGNARYELAFSQDRKRGQPANLFDMIKIGTNKDGSVFVTAPPFRESDRKQMQKVKMDVNGELVIKLPKNAEVIQTNAHSKPGMFSGGYSWKIEKADQRPTMVFRLK
jgi:hypothetical protein